MNKSVLRERSMDFAVEIVNLTKQMQESKEFILSAQLMRSATSIGANICEANYAQSRADFVSKLQIALKECYETQYWLELLVRTDYINNEKYINYNNSAEAIKAMLIKSINTSKSK